MDKKFAWVAASIAVLFLLFGCTQTGMLGGTTGGNQMADSVDSNFADGASLDANSADKNSTNYNNLAQFRKVKAGDTVSVHYVGRLKDGSIFDSSVGKDALTFVAGAGQMIKGFDAAVLGMSVGDSKTVEIPPKDAYGEVNPQMIVVLDANKFGNFSEIEAGMKVGADGSLSGVVESKTDTNATINFNHELAGKTLVFEIVLVSIS